MPLCSLHFLCPNAPLFPFIPSNFTIILINPFYGCTWQDVLCIYCRLTPWILNSYAYNKLYVLHSHHHDFVGSSHQTPEMTENLRAKFIASWLYIKLIFPDLSILSPAMIADNLVFIFSCNHPLLGFVKYYIIYNFLTFGICSQHLFHSYSIQVLCPSSITCSQYWRNSPTFTKARKRHCGQLCQALF